MCVGCAVFVVPLFDCAAVPNMQTIGLGPQRLQCVPAVVLRYMPFHVGLSRERHRCVRYLVDPASSHMLVSKIKPCMYEFKCCECKAANGSLEQL